jgi:hypothetical protein
VASKSLAKWLKMLWENWGVCAWCRFECSCPDVYVFCPLRRGGSPSFYRPRRGRITNMPHYSATRGGMACAVVELAAKDSPGFFRGPSGLSPTVAPEHW